MRKHISHEEIRTAFSEIYNTFYLGNRIDDGRVRTDVEWEKLIRDADFLREKYNSELVTKIVNSLLDEFEEQDKVYRKVGRNGRFS